MDEAQAGIKIAERNINSLRYAYDTTLMAESEEELKSLLMKVKEDSDKLNIQKTKIMASGVPTLNANRWGKSGSSDRFIFFGSQITAEDVCNNDIKRHLLLGRKAVTNLAY